MAYIICLTEETLLVKNVTPLEQQPDSDLAIVSPGQRIGVVNNSIKRVSGNLAQLTLAGQLTWAPGVEPIPDGSIRYFNPARFEIPEDAWQLILTSSGNIPPMGSTPKPINVSGSSSMARTGKTLAKEQIVAIAQRFKIEPETIMAVLDVESSGRGFLASGKPIILFEAHWFGKFTDDIYNDTHPHISCRTWAEAKAQYIGDEGEWPRLEEARRLNAEAANKSASWGIGQVMGFNYDSCGYSDVFKFVADMEISEAKQVEAMIKFIESQKIIDELQRRDWAGFAYYYNGEGYKQNNYDGKLEQAYREYINNQAFRSIAPDSDHAPPVESVRKAFDPNQPIDWNDANCRVSKFFTVGEVTQKDPRRMPVPGSSEEKNCLNLARELDKVREAWGSPIGVTSWYRPEPINTEVGGVSNSQHIFGLAADIYTMDSDGFSQRDHEFENWLDTRAWKDRALGYGVSSGRGFTHVDLRSYVRWNY